MKAQALWLPGNFPTTNELLNQARATGFYEGRRRAEGGKAPSTSFNKTIAAIRHQAWAHAKAARLEKVVDGRVVLGFLHLGSGRRDPSSWYLAAKAIEDGLVDAEVLASDRFNVAGSRGRAVAFGAAVWRAFVARVTGVEPSTVGMLVTLDPQEGGEDASL